jgi:hypothetical protein
LFSVESVAAIDRLVDLEALVAECRRDGVDDRGLVVDDEDPAACGGSVHVPIVSGFPVSGL